jgi:hypothetical protein
MASANIPQISQEPIRMKYSDIHQNYRFRLPKIHPVLAEIEIDQEDWHRFEQLSDDNRDTEIVGHDAIPDGRITVYVACIDEDTRRKLDDGWA